MSLAITRQVDLEQPHLLQTNVGATCFRYLQIVKDRLERAGHTVCYVTKTNRDRGQFIPPGFGQHQITGYDHQQYTATGVSHDALYVDGDQIDCIVSGNYEAMPIYDGSGRQVTGKPGWSDPVPRHDWRAWNPPLPKELERRFPSVPPPPPVAQAPAPAPPAAPVLDFPPRDLTGRFFLALDERYQRGGRSNRTGEEGSGALHVDNEGLFVWISEFLRHYLVARGTHEERYRAAAGAVLAEIDRAWPR